MIKAPIPLVERSKARVCGRSLAGITGSNSTGGARMFVLYSKDKSQDKEVPYSTKRELNKFQALGPTQPPI